MLPYEDCGPSRLPEMLRSCDRLLELEVLAASSRIADPERLWQVLSSLTSLRKLILLCSEAEEWMFEPCDEFSSFAMFDDPSEAQDSLQTVVLTSAPSEPSGLVLRPIASTFPNLESLNLSTRRQHLRPEHLALLPHSLTSVELPQHDLIDCTSIHRFSVLPNIRHLKVCVEEEVSLAGQVLPPTVTALHLTGWRTASIPKEFWSSGTQEDGNTAVSNLVSLQVYSISLESFRALPSSLEYLRLTSSLTQSVIEPDEHAFEHLPRLKSMILDSGYSFGKGGFTQFPPSLTKLQSRHILCDNGQALQLPVHLRTLETSEDTMDAELLNNIFRDKLPSSLTVLNFTGCEWSREMFSALPPTLKELRILFLTNTVSILDATSVLSVLPRGLNVLDCLELTLHRRKQHLYVRPEGFKDLPRQLSKFRCGVLFEGDHHPKDLANFIGDLPRSLTTLGLDHYTTKEVEIIDEKKLKAAQTIAYAMILHKVKHGSVYSGSTASSSTPMVGGTGPEANNIKPISAQPSWTADMMSELPSRLTNLQFYRVTKETKWTSTEMQHLNLSDLGSLLIQGGMMTVSSITCLPRSLRTLTLSCDFDDDAKIFALLPRHLTCLQLPFVYNIREESLSDLPRSLVSLEMAEGQCYLTPESAKLLPLSMSVAEGALQIGLRTIKSIYRSEPLREPDLRTKWSD